MSLEIPTRLTGGGLLALAGSGEYLPPMAEVDRWLMARLGEPARVICLATAAGTEGAERLAYWDRLGTAHFQSLGAASVTALPVYDRSGAESGELAAAIETANFVYFSGGKPAYLFQTLQNSLVWAAVEGVLARGGVVAGCSAGAMIFGGRIPSSLFSAGWLEGFDYLPGSAVLPHFDEFPALVTRALPLLEAGQRLVGIDGSTALICSAGGCQVRGRGGVTVMHGSARRVIRAGEVV